MDGTGRQHYRQAQMIQLMCWALELARTVWWMPRDRRAMGRHRRPSAPQLTLFDSCTRLNGLLASFGDVRWGPTPIPVWRASDAPEVWRQD
jgi:hypothetical protein